MEIHSDLPDSVAVGKPSPEFTLDATTMVRKDETHLLHTLLGDLKSIAGTVEANAELSSQGDDFRVPVHFGVNKVALPDSDRAFAVTATGTAPSRTFHHPGTVRIAVGDLTLKLTGRKANGQPMGTVKVPCKLHTRPELVVASFEVTGTGKTTGRPASGASGADSTAGSTSGGSSALPESAASGPVRGTLANTGQDTKDLMLLAVGTLAAGSSFFLHGSQLKRRRRAGHDS